METSRLQGTTKQLGQEIIAHYCWVSQVKQDETICEMFLFSRADVACKPLYSFITVLLKAHMQFRQFTCNEL